MQYQKFPSVHPVRVTTSVRLGVAAVAACFIAAPAYPNPVNPKVISGTASFNQAGNVLTVTNSNGAIINWDKFSIKAGETTHFAQTAASSSVLNRVLNDPSAIYGTLSSNGRVWLVNPAGIMVGPGGRVDTAAFVASTLSIRNEDFLAGRHLFVNDGSAKNVINQGEIRTPAGGSVYLIGSNVGNEGIITTPQGETILAAGATVSLIDSATPGVKVDITGAAGNGTNLGEITAAAGRIGIAGVIVRNSGQLNASSVVNDGGRIFLKASRDAYVDGRGRIVTTGTRGGSVDVLGERVAVTDTASIDASGARGGGSIRVGGDYQGGNPDVPNASTTYFGRDASLKADATEVGAGGTVIVWADDTTRAYGSISARGGAVSGDGGLVETSGKRYLDTPGIRVDVGAGKGSGGTWLLDPSAINIVASGTTDTGYAAGIFSYGAEVGTLVDDDLNAALAGGGSVIVHTGGAGSGNGNITATGVSISGSGSLTLAAYGGGGADGDIDISGGSVINVAGGFKALAGWDGSGYAGSDIIAGKGNISISAAKIVAASQVDLHAGNDISLGHTGTGPGTWIQSSGAMSVSAGHDLKLTGGAAAMFSPSNWEGSGVMLRGDGGQTISVNNQIVLQAGSADNAAYAGYPQYGGSVVIRSGGNQTIDARDLHLLAGAQGHDNAATVEAYGSQTITLGTPGLAAGNLIISGGGDNTATTGGTTAYGGVGSYNNLAELKQESPTGSQVINFVYGGSVVQLTAGNGTGYGGFHNLDYPASQGWTSNNFAAIHNEGNGSLNDGYSQVIDFNYGGSLTLTGGEAGNSNFASIGNRGEGKLLIGSSNGVANLAAIALHGGASGGIEAGGHSLSNSADIYSTAASALAQVYGSSITIVGEGGAATIGGAGIGARNLWLETPGNLTLIGGGSDIATATPIPGGATAAYIATNDYGSGAITIKVAGNVSLTGGDGYGGAALIGTVSGGPSTSIEIGAYGSVTLASGINSSAAIGNMAQSAGYGGADVQLYSMGDMSLTGTANAGVMIGSVYGGAATSVTLGSQRDITLAHALVGNKQAAAASIEFYGGYAEGGGSSSYGGSLSFSNVKIGSALGDAAIAFYAAYGGASTGNISFTDSGAYGSSIAVTAYGDLTLTGVNAGVRLQSTGAGGMNIDVGNLYAYGGDVIKPAGTDFFGLPTGYHGAGVLLYAAGAGSQTITVDNGIELRAGSADNTSYAGASFYGGSAVIRSDAGQTISANSILLRGGSGGHDNQAAIANYSTASQTINANSIQIEAGGSAATDFNDGASIFSSYGSQFINITGSGGAITLYGGAGGATAAAYGGLAGANYGGDCATYGGDINYCYTSGNRAEIVHRDSSGAYEQTIAFLDGVGSISMYGGSDGAGNSAEIRNESNSYGGNPGPLSIGSATYGADIYIRGGSSGGKTVYGSNGKFYDERNGAGIEGNSDVTIYAGSIMLDGGSGGVSGAIIGGGTDSGGTMNIHATGDVTLQGGGGGSIAAMNDGSQTYKLTTPAAIGSDRDITINMTVDGDLNVYAGSGAGGLAMIGSLDGKPTLTINANNVNLLAYGSSAMMGSDSATYGASVALNAAGSIALTDSAAHGARIGSLYDTASATSVTLSARDDISIGSATGYGALVGVKSPSGNATISIYAGNNGYGGDLLLDSSSRIRAGGGTATFKAEQTTSTNGKLTQNAGSVVYGGDVSLGSGGNLTLDGDVYATASVGVYGGMYVANAAMAASDHGGDVALGGQVQASGGDVRVYARTGALTKARGKIDQSGGSISGANVYLYAQGDLNLAGSVSSDYSEGIQAFAGIGFSPCDGECPDTGASSFYGGNLVLASAGSLSSGGTLDIGAMVGSDNAANGGVALHGTTGANRNIGIIGGGDVTIDNSVDAIGYGGTATLTIKAGVSQAGNPTGAGGNLLVSAALSGNDGVSLSAAAGSNSGLSGDITQTAGSILSDAGNIEIIAGGSVTLDGSVTATAGNLMVRAGYLALNGYGYSSTYGGNVSIGGGITASGSVGISANVGYGYESGNGNGNISQTGGSIVGASVDIMAGGSVTLDGTVTANSSATTVKAGYQTGYFGYDYANGRTSYGGDISVGGTINGNSGVALIAEGGYSSGTKGDIISTGILGTTAGAITIIGGGKVDLSGSISAYGGQAMVKSGFSYYDSEPSGSGGDITLYSGSLLYGEQGAELRAGNGSASYGDILLHTGAELRSGDYSDALIVGAGNVTIDGKVSADEEIIIGAGLDPASPYGPSSGGNGGNISFGASSIVESRSGYDSEVVSLVTFGGTRSSGDIVQAAGAKMTIGYGNVNVLAYGDARMDGSTTITDAGGYGIRIAAGMENASGISSSFSGPVRAGSSNIVSVGTLTATAGEVEIIAAGAIMQATGNLSGTNIGAQDVTLTSGYGGAPGGLAISTNTAVGSGGSVTALVSDASATYAGIRISNSGDAPALVNLNNSAVPGSTISFYNGGDLDLGGVTGFTVSGGEVNIESGANLIHTSSSLTATDSLLLSAGGNLTVSGALSTAGDLKLGATSGAVTVDAGIGGSNVELAAPTIRINAAVTAARNAALIGSEIELAAGVTANGSSATPSTVNGIAYTGVAFIAGNVHGDGAGAYLRATDSTGDVSGLVSGNITLTNGAYFKAGNDVDLVLTGVDSTLSLSGLSYLWAVNPNSITLDFTTRASGGVMIDGVATTTSSSSGSGLFVGAGKSPATAGAGLHLAYLPAAPGADQTLTNSITSATEKASTTEAPTEEAAAPPPPPAKADADKPLVDLGKTVGGTEGTFGSETGTAPITGTTETTGTVGTTEAPGTVAAVGTTETSGTAGATGTTETSASAETKPAAATNGDKPPAETKTAAKEEGSKEAAKDEKKEEKKEEKKDEKKDKKDKKSDDAKGEKKDEKPAQKKVAQCS